MPEKRKSSLNFENAEMSKKRPSLENLLKEYH